MPSITSITMQKDNNRANLYLDGAFVCGMEISVVVKHGLKVGREITIDQLTNLQFESDKEKAFDKALSLIERQLYTKKALRDKLKTKGYSLEVIDEVIKKLEDYKYINDESFARNYIVSHKNKSKKEIEQALMIKGIERQIVYNVIDEMMIDDSNAVCDLADKFMKYKEVNKENLNKLYAYLYRKGFSVESIKSQMARFSADIDDFY